MAYEQMEALRQQKLL